ncbi:hypothetical protein RJT34_29756 [Clitoria ternatea]|uniref:Uncharacterized protein n=1 Tax=Clitoria ternatea TaxID=43366 RepID=A0AAN9I217_CLITE
MKRGIEEFLGFTYFVLDHTSKCHQGTNKGITKYKLELKALYWLFTYVLSTRHILPHRLIKEFPRQTNFASSARVVLPGVLLCG